MIAVRIVMGALIALLVVVIAIPAVVMVDLLVGGSGLGLCPDGLGQCDTSLFALLEIALILLTVATVLGFGIAGCYRFLAKQSRPNAFGG